MHSKMIGLLILDVSFFYNVWGMRWSRETMDLRQGRLKISAGGSNTASVLLTERRRGDARLSFPGCRSGLDFFFLLKISTSPTLPILFKGRSGADTAWNRCRRRN